MQIDFQDFSIFVFKVNYVFIEEKYNPVEKVVTDEAELDGIEIDGIWNLENLPRTVFIEYECWNLKVAVDQSISQCISFPLPNNDTS